MRRALRHLKHQPLSFICASFCSLYQYAAVAQYPGMDSWFRIFPYLPEGRARALHAANYFHCRSLFDVLVVSGDEWSRDVDWGVIVVSDEGKSLVERRRITKQNLIAVLDQTLELSSYSFAKKMFWTSLGSCQPASSRWKRRCLHGGCGSFVESTGFC